MSTAEPSPENPAVKLADLLPVLAHRYMSRSLPVERLPGTWFRFPDLNVPREWPLSTLFLLGVPPFGPAPVSFWRGSAWKSGAFGQVLCRGTDVLGVGLSGQTSQQVEPGLPLPSRPLGRDTSAGPSRMPRGLSRQDVRQRIMIKTANRAERIGEQTGVPPPSRELGYPSWLAPASRLIRPQTLSLWGLHARGREFSLRRTAAYL